MPHSLSPPTPSHSLDHGELPDAPTEGPQLNENEDIADRDDIKAEEIDDIDLVGSAESAHGSVKEADSNVKLPDTKIKLEEDLFGADDSGDDADYLASSMPEVKGESSPAAPVSFAPTARYSDPEIMYAFYQRLFPFRPLFQWLNHSSTPTNDFANREFAFTLQNDAYLRYQSFPTSDLLRKEILRLNPSRFEIGPVYTTNPRDRKTLRKSSNFRPLSKELVFDIDLTDYDEIRTCCSKAEICNKCWQFITMAVKVVDAALRDDFGFKHIMWVYSGRRGAHAWICDKRAREMEDSKRKAIAGYLEVIKGGSQSGKKVNVKRPLHPHLARSLDVLKNHFQTDILLDQDPWQEQDKFEKLLQLLPDRNLNESLRKKWDSAPDRSSKSKWADIDSLAKTGASKTLDSKSLLEAKQDIVLEYTYPRLDVEVSKKLIHLLKSPFVVHPGTGRVCVPIDTRQLDEFDPLSVPTVTELLGEIDKWDSENKTTAAEGDSKRIQDYEKTRLKPYVDYFKSFVASLLKEERPIKSEVSSKDTMEF